tara:strand:- start:52 stop:507 length:456 start_codon:yes stop_codon:yes gene_type:complete
MKKIRVILPAIFLFIVSCAKPYVTERSYPEDKNLNCEELELAVFEAEKYKKDAEYAKTATGGNMTRMLMFWPAWAGTFHNADKAIIAAEDRIYHLTVLMKGKKCDKIEVSNTYTERSPKSVPTQLKELKELYDTGMINESEYKKGKKKILK